MKLTLTVFLTCFLQAFTEENAPYLQIQNIDNLTTPIQSTIWVKPGAKLVLKCFVNCTKCTDRYSVRWHRNKAKKSPYLRLSILDTGTYTCRHARRNLTKNVTLKVINRKKRDDYFSKPSFSDIDDFIKREKDIVEQFNSKWPPYITDERDWKHRMHEDKHDYESKLTHKPVPKIVIIIVIVVVMAAVLSIIFYCTRLMIKKRLVTTPTRPRQTDPRELRSLNVEPPNYRTQINPYPPVVNPVQASNEESTPPPSYEEAMYNLPNGNSRPSAPHL